MAMQTLCIPFMDGLLLSPSFAPLATTATTPSWHGLLFHRSSRWPIVCASITTVAVVPQRETNPRKQLVITGMGLVSVFRNSVDVYYEKLLDGKSGIGPIDQFDASEFPMRFADQIRGFSLEGYIDGKNDCRLDDCPWYCLVSGKKALESASLGIGSKAFSMVMESLEHAMKRDAPIIAEYRGGAVNCDAYHMTDPRADGLGVSSCIQKSLEEAGIAPEEVNYINAHATSTLAGDLAEVNAIKQVFKNTSDIKINSMIWHCLGAAGGLEAIATVKAISTGWLHPTINQFNLEPAVEFDTVANKKQPHEVNVAISNSFGFGGHNSVVVLAPFKP